MSSLKKILITILNCVQNSEKISITRYGEMVAILTLKIKTIDLSDMMELDEELDSFDKGNAVINS